MNRILLTTIFLAMGRLGVCQVADGLTPLQRKQLTVLSEPATLYKGFFRIGYNVKYSPPGRSFDEKGKIRTPSEVNFAGKFMDHSLSVSYGLFDRLELSVKLPYVNDNLRGLIELNSTNNLQQKVNFDIERRGFKDLQTKVKFQVVKESTSIPSLVAMIQADFPTGNNKRSMVIDEVTSNTRIKDITGGVGTILHTTLQLRKVMYPYLLLAEFTYIFGADGEIIENNQAIEVVGANNAIWQLTAGMHLNEWITLTGKMFYQRLFFVNEYAPNQPVTFSQDSFQELLTFDPTLTFQFGRFRCEQVIAIPLAGKIFSSELEYSASLLYTF